MQVSQWLVRERQPFPRVEGDSRGALVLVFAPVERLESEAALAWLRDSFSGAILAGCSTAGEISPEGVADGGITVTRVRFDHARVRSAEVPVPTMAESAAAGYWLAAELGAPDLAHVLVLSDGIGVNGSALAHGLDRGLPKRVPVTGGLAGDGGRFLRTLVLGAGGAAERRAVAVGLYGPDLLVGHGSLGGWEAFGPIRQVTRAAENVVHELDGRPALGMYESYLGDEAKHLPAAGLHFPLELVPADRRTFGLIRTLLQVDRQDGSLTFAGNVPEGALVRLMHGTRERLVEAAASAASEAVGEATGWELGLLISCVGRRLLLGAYTDREIDAAAGVLGEGVPLTGFYSNGELSPLARSGRCELHNQTMTITTLLELR